MRSPEVTGGAGFSFEAQVGAIYLSSLLQGSAAPGLSDGQVCRVAFQQASLGEPLDDIIVDAILPDDSRRRLSLQAKTSLTISASKTNSDFRDIIKNCWKTLKGGSFRIGYDRYGAVVAHISDSKHRALTTICEQARNCASSKEFLLAPGGKSRWSGKQDEVFKSVQTLLSELPDVLPTEHEIYEFFQHLVLLKLDVLAEPAPHRASAIAQLQLCVQQRTHNDASNLYSKLVEIADGAKNLAGSLDRKTLLTRLGGSFRLKFNTSASLAVSKLDEFARRSIEDIRTTIDGFHVDRSAYIANIQNTIERNRFIYIRGLPGSGKSAVLRGLAEIARQNGPILFFHSSRVVGSSWDEFANALSLGGAALHEILAELECCGSRTLFIDGLDRLDASGRNVILDVLNTALNDSDFSDWKLVATSRDEGVEPLRNWLPDRLLQDGAAICEVRPLDEDEARQLVEHNPALSPFLFGNDSFVEIGRRPFFAAVLSQQFSTGDVANLSGEVDLVDAWWGGGGYAAAQADRLSRNRALLEIAQLSEGKVGLPVRIRELSNGATGVLYDLIADGILQEVRTGLTIRFTHDIFHEWTIFKVLEDVGDDWLELLKKYGEPPALGRVVGLLSQRSFFSEGEWAGQLHSLSCDVSVRSQWLRAWLLAPISAPAFMQKFDVYAKVAEAEEFRWLKKILLWFQAERSAPNRNILENIKPADGIDAGKIIRLADYFAWPNEMRTWRRVMSWVVARASEWPPEVVAATVALIQVWQNAFGQLPNDVSTKLLRLCLTWLHSVEEDRHPRDFHNRTTNWAVLSSSQLKNLEKELRRLVVGAHASAEVSAQYISELMESERHGAVAAQEVIGQSTHLAKQSPKLLVDYILKITLTDLPEEQLRKWEEREAREREARAKAMERIKKIPPEERSFSDRMTAGSPIGIGPDFGMFEELRLCLRDDLRCFYPPSPLREPFHSLLSDSPAEGLRLVQSLCNHAIECWKQLKRLNFRSRCAPIPIELDFPWGKQKFWGGRTEYLWFRGMLGPQVLECALPALEEWAFDRVENGESIDDVIRAVLDGNECVAVLGIACSIAVSYQHVSPVTLPLVASQRLWHYDLHRLVQESPGVSPRLMGFALNRHETSHIKAIRESDERASRRVTIRETLLLFILGKDRELAEVASKSVQNFPNNLPFCFEEEKNNEVVVSELRETAEIWAELAKRENYRISSLPDDSEKFAIEVENPKNETPEAQERMAQFERSAAGLSLDNWVRKAYETGLEELAQDELRLKLSEAKAAFSNDLFGERTYDKGFNQSGVAGVAAIAIERQDLITKADLKWARHITKFAARIREPRHEPFIEQAKLFSHPALYAARALAAEIITDPKDKRSQRELLALVAHPLNDLANEALRSAFKCFSSNPRFAWAALDLALRLTVHERDIGQGYDRLILPTLQERKRLIVSTLKLASKQIVWPLPRPPEAWARTAQLDDDGNPVLRESTTLLRWDRLTRVATALPVEAFLSDEACRFEILNLMRSWFDWMLSREEGAKRKSRRRDHDKPTADLSEFRDALADCLRRAYDVLSIDEARAHTLDDLLGLNDELFTDLVAPMVRSWVAGGVADADHVDKKTIEYLSLCLDRLLQRADLDQARSWARGDVSGFEMPYLIKDYLFVSVLDAPAAARFANGDWQDVELITPFAEKLIKRAGWMPFVAAQFILMSERARDHLSTGWFADRVLEILCFDKIDLLSFQEHMIPARIATLVQYFADRSPTLPLSEAGKLLRILDTLVDLGDRRSATLQLSPAFRNITLN
ncbi:ATP-binding protein [Alkalicaulis satelles]|uniref:ATP-binding protein n=1 Tax=Alkalicaulis satelles TaxID=2609175 RepID=UPI0018EC77B2|nr:ATP-binding protein [Alkalicaulis satelles]